MEQQNRPTSREIIELVRLKIGTQYVRASDTDVAKALGVGRASVSRWINNDGVMSVDTLMNANELLQLAPDAIGEFALRLMAEAREGKPADSLTMAANYMREWAIRCEKEMQSLGKKAGAAILAVVFVLAALSGQVVRSDGGTASRVQFIHYAQYRRRFNRWLWALLRGTFSPLATER